jgi:long-chain acyl-CoA synthetase
LDSTRLVIDENGWLKTGDLGKLDKKGRLVIVGRAKEVVVSATGENIYIEDVEKRLGSIAGIKEFALVGVPEAKGGERLGMLAVFEVKEGEDPARARLSARSKIQSAVASLPINQRPALLEVTEEALPRTATLKPKRREIAALLNNLQSNQDNARVAGQLQAPVSRAVVYVTGADADRLHAGTRLREDLGFDSLMWTDLSLALERESGVRCSADALSRCETLGEIEALSRKGSVQEQVVEDVVEEKVEIPDFLVPPLKTALGTVQKFANGTLLDTRVTGRAFIPQNRPALVISNHCSHLDMGLVKYGLGDYGRQMVSMAASDYFFEGNKWWVAYWESLTNLKPLDRSGGYRASFEQAKQAIEEGSVVLIFPEGTRQPDGRLGAFKPMVGKLALETGRDILPIYLDGTHKVLPKGASLPRGRNVEVRIGPPIRVEKMLEWTEGMRPNDAARLVTRVMRDAVVALRDGTLLDPERLTAADLADETPKIDPIVATFQSLPGRFRSDSLEEPMSWYFSLGEGENLRWTVVAAPGRCEVIPGKPPGGKAECVVKTSPELMMKIIREAYAPEVSEFMSGTIKTNEIPLLMKFAETFRLGAEAK